MDVSTVINRREGRSLEEQVKSVTRYLLVQRIQQHMSNSGGANNNNKQQLLLLSKSDLDQVEHAVWRMFHKHLQHQPPHHNHHKHVNHKNNNNSNNNNGMQQHSADDWMRRVIQGAIHDFDPNLGYDECDEDDCDDDDGDSDTHTPENMTHMRGIGGDQQQQQHTSRCRSGSRSGSNNSSSSRKRSGSSSSSSDSSSSRAQHQPSLASIDWDEVWNA